MQGTAPELPKDWASHVEFIQQWRMMEPLFDSIAKLRPAVFLSRDVMAPARSRTDISNAAREAVAALVKVDGINSPVGRKITEELTAADRRAVMSMLIETMREADWSAPVPGFYGAILLTKVSPEAKVEFKAFIDGLQVGQMDKGMRFLLKNAGMIGGK